MAQLIRRSDRRTNHRIRFGLGAVVIASVVIAGATACGGSDTREVDPATTGSGPTVPSSIPWDQSRDGLIETLTKMELNADQAACVIDRMDELDRSGTKPSDGDRTKVEKLIEDCLTPG